MEKIKVLLLSVAFTLLSSNAYNQVQFYFDTYNVNDSQVEEVFDSNPLAVGAVYTLEVEGTYSIWESSYWSSPCGNSESNPIYSSFPSNLDSGLVGFDPEYIFGMAKTSKCSGRTLPEQTSRIEYSVDSGATWFHPSTNTSYNTNHTYYYEVTGQGYPLGVRQVSAYNSDDYGKLRINLTQKNFTCNAQMDFNTYNPDDLVIEEVFDNDSLALGATYSLEIDGTYSIWSSSFWTNPCGNPELFPIYSSFPSTSDSGLVGFDPEYIFGLANSTKCSGRTLPEQTNRIEISLDNGATWFHPSTSDAYNLAHKYTYSVVGQGYPIGVRQTSELNSDDYGVLKFNLSTFCTSPRSKKSAIVENKIKLNIYPIPSDQFIYIESEQEDLKAIRLFDLNGKEHNINISRQDKRRVEMKVNSLSDGIYIVNIETRNGKSTNSKIIVSH